MRLNDIQPGKGARGSTKRVGRGTGSGLGKTAGRGHDGQNSRSGGGVKPGFEGGQMPLAKRVPKFGFNSSVARVTAEVRTQELNAITDGVVSLATLKQANLVRKDAQRAKIVVSGELRQSVTVRGVAVSRGARSSIEQAGGTVEE